MPDTVICATDTVQLGATTNGLKFSWSPAATIIDPTVLNALAIPTGTTSYQLTATIGGCSATDQVTIRTVPYPGSNAGPDTIICYHTSAQLHAAINGNSFTWTPSAGLSDPNSTDPIAAPAASTIYTLTVYDNLGCPKPGISSVVVTMLPKVNAFAGHDTSVVIGQPLQFNGTGGTGYFWQPSTGLNHNDIANPTGYYDGSFDSIQYKLLVMNESGCVDSAYITVRVFKTNPQIFVPTAFTPNGDGNNDVFRPIAVGITKIEYFSVFNRWGELVFSTTVNGKGWDGTVSGKQQGSGTFVWMVKGVDYTGKVVVEKGTVTLIRN
jgi:gliding motility-associated-like protein